MKNFRSSKVLKPMEPQIRQQSNLRSKVKLLEQQIEMLQKSNLNIFIPISEHNVQPTHDYQSIIKQLRTKVSFLQNQNQLHKHSIKKLQREKQQMKRQHYDQVQILKQSIKTLKQMNDQLTSNIDQLNQKIEQLSEKYEDLQRQCIQKTVELKYTVQQLHQQQLKTGSLAKKLKQLMSKIDCVIHGARIHKSAQQKLICIPKQEYDGLKSQITMLELEIEKLKRVNYRQMISLGTKKSDIGEQIVRLKKNIDVQLGLQGTSKHSEDFLKIYKGTQQMFDSLIKQCKT